jgi:hypothetical protein
MLNPFNTSPPKINNDSTASATVLMVETARQGFVCEVDQVAKWHQRYRTICDPVVDHHGVVDRIPGKYQDRRHVVRLNSSWKIGTSRPWLSRRARRDRRPTPNCHSRNQM